MSLKGVAKETIAITDRGGYHAPSGAWVSLEDAHGEALTGTRLYTPPALSDLHAGLTPPAQRSSCDIEVREGTTQAIAMELVRGEGVQDLVLLDFASARNVAGGFVRGAKAQEEDLARCSTLYRCLQSQPTYYEVNREQESLLYTDHIIYCPAVPFFRASGRDLLEAPYTASVITAPAPNAGQYLRLYPSGEAQVDEALRKRAAYVLAIARDNKHSTLLLGAWGCGVFRNDPARVASAFADALEAPEFDGAFRRVVFGIFDRSRRQATLRAFRTQFLAEIA